MVQEQGLGWKDTVSSSASKKFLKMIKSYKLYLIRRYSDAIPEEKIIRTLEIKREAEAIVQLFKVWCQAKIWIWIGVFKECESDPEAKKGNNADMLAKCRAGLVDYQV